VSRPVLVLLSAPGCHLCHDLRAVIERVLPAYDAVLEERDVRADPETKRRYALEIPVLLLDGAEVLRHRTTEDELRARLDPLLRR
jgi:thioredoxin-like negative regulator of GroEL